MALTNQLEMQQVDINNEFLNGSPQEEVYISQPPGFEKKDLSLVCKFHKLYTGLSKLSGSGTRS